MLCAFFFLASHMAMAKTYTSVKSGNFNDCTVWKTMLLEQSGNDVFVIASGHTVTVPRNVKMYLSKIVLTDATSRVILTDATSVLSTTGAGTTLDCSSDYRLSVALESFQSYHMNDYGSGAAATIPLEVNFLARFSGPTGIAQIAHKQGPNSFQYGGDCSGPGKTLWASVNRQIFFYFKKDIDELDHDYDWSAKLDYDASAEYKMWLIHVREEDSPVIHGDPHDNPTGIDKTIIPGNLLDLSEARVVHVDDVHGIRFENNRRLEAALLTPDADYNITVRVFMDGSHCMGDGVWTLTFRARFEKK